MWIDHLFSEKRARGGRHASETCGRFIESSIELNCIMVRHRSQKSEGDSNVYEQRKISSDKVKVFL